MSLSKALLTLIFLVLLAPGNVRSQSGDWVETTLRSMTLEEKVGQIFIADLVAVYVHKQSPAYTLAEHFVQQYHVGGFILAGGTVTDIAVTTNRLQRESKLPVEQFEEPVRRRPLIRARREMHCQRSTVRLAGGQRTCRPRFLLNPCL